MSTSRRRKNQEAFTVPESSRGEEDEEAKTRKKNKVVRRKMPKMRRARDGTLHARKVGPAGMPSLVDQVG